MEAPPPARAPGEVEVWVVAVELVVGTEVPPDVPLDVVVGVGAVVVGVEVVTVEVDVERVAVGWEGVAGGGPAEDEPDVFASEPPPQAPIATAAATATTPPPARAAARLMTPR